MSDLFREFRAIDERRSVEIEATRTISGVCCINQDVCTSDESHRVCVDIVFRDLACFGNGSRIGNQHERLREHARVSLDRFVRDVGGVGGGASAVYDGPRHRH